MSSAPDTCGPRTRLFRHGCGSGSRELPILRVVLQTNLAGDRAVAVLGHELQHVVEALASRRSSNASSLSALFMELDATHTPGAAHFETERAKQIAANVLEELRAR